MGSIYTLNECLDEVLRLYRKGYSVEEAIKIVKGYKESDQTIPSNHKQIFKDIISSTEDLDNDQLYDIESGQTIRDLRGI
ncbi:MAG: hypothetical protein E6441_13245 [Clostridium sp.]|uniref:hypothetical protein n=1 Tax=Clostridium TaxID=1485 RepID=UPI00290B5B7A|nr:hypothetical protein [Clostridium sp.]MDU5209580.1 hypothetical protein [Clostridium sp.]MDU6762422.1 hypothetical protein [Clostridium sp.]